MLYFIFEEEIRNLIGANAKKDLIMAEQAETIQRLEPLSVLGERTAHVVHSFKNTMNQVSVAEFLLEHKRDVDGALERLKVYSKSMDERIKNILMVSQAGHRQVPEEFDLGSLLDGINFIYLQEDSFLKHGYTHLSVPEHPVLVKAVRWSVILLMENLLRNALDALIESGHYGKIEITLTDDELIVSNDGGAMPLCDQCTETSCLACQKYGKIGQTYKSGGSGHGLAQVFQTIREAGWDLKIRSELTWTLFHIKFKP